MSQQPITRSQKAKGPAAPTAVSDPPPSSPGQIHGSTRWRSRAARIASGSGPSSPVYLSAEAVYDPADSLQSKVAPSQSASGSAPQTTSAGAGGSGLPHTVRPPGSAMPISPLGGSPAGSDAEGDEDVVMEAASAADLTRALRELTVRLPVPRDAAETRIDAAKVSLDACTSDSMIVAVFARDFQPDVRDFLRKYRDDVELVATARSALARLKRHVANKSYPTALNAIKVPAVQFTKAFVNASDDERERGKYSTPTGGRAGFEAVMSARISWVKDQILADWVKEKEREVSYLEQSANAADAITRLEGAFTERTHQLRARYDYLNGRPRHDELVADVEFQGVVSVALCAAVVARLNAVVLAEEDRKLAASLKKLDISKPAEEAAANAPPNDLSEIKKMMSGFSQKLDATNKKVIDNCYHLLLVCAGHLVLTPPLLQRLIVDTIDFGRKEVRRQQEEERQGEDRTHRREKGRQKGKGRQSRQKPRRVQAQGQEEQREPAAEAEAEAATRQRQEKEWQEVGATFDIVSSSSSGIGLFEFSDSYGLSWVTLFSTCRFLSMSFSPSILLDRRLRRLAQFCCLVYECTIASPKINILDYSTYPDISVLIEFDILFTVMSRFAPKWLLSSRRFTNRLHSNVDIDIPKEVIGTFSAGLKYISPIYINKNLVKEAWSDFETRAHRSWYQVEFPEQELEDLKNEKKSTDPFYNLPIPFKSKDPKHTKPLGEDFVKDERIDAILQRGWTELSHLLKNVPSLDRNERSVDLELKNCLEWCWDNNVLIKPTDKNLGTALISIRWYNEKVSNFLLNNPGYRIISQNEARSLLQTQVEDIRTLANTDVTKKFTGNLSSFIMSRLPPMRWKKDPQTGERYPQDEKWDELVIQLPVFTGLPKIHKTPWGIRPVVPCHSVIQGPASEFLSTVLKTLLPEFPQILTNTKELVHHIESSANPKFKKFTPYSWNRKVFICTADIEGFYTNVPIDTCRAKIGELALEIFGNTRSGKTKALWLMELFDVQQKTLVMRAKINGKWEFVEQTNGLAMGMPAAPDIANLYAAWFEKRFPVRWYKHCLVFKRYIDDIFCLISAEDRDHCEQILGDYQIPGLKLNWEVSETNAVFLDLEVWRNPYSQDQRIKYRPYRKPLNNFERLPWCTGHSLQLLRAAFKSEMHRFAVSSWSISIYNEELDWLKDLYISRGYPPVTVVAWIKKFKDNAYKNRLDVEFSTEKEASVWPLKSVMNPVWLKLNLGMVSESMLEAARPHFDGSTDVSLLGGEDRRSFGRFHWSFDKWFHRLVASQKRPMNMGDKENKHNRDLLEIQGKHSKFALGGRSVDQRGEDEIIALLTNTLDSAADEPYDEATHW
jgi:hypothetical protein